MHKAIKSRTESPLIVDLDGTLMVGDSAWEGLRRQVLKGPRGIWQLLCSLSMGKANLKKWLLDQNPVDVRELYFRKEIIEIIEEAKKRGREVKIVSGAPIELVDQVAQYLNLGSRGHIGSTRGENITKTKAGRLEKQYGKEGFDYLGNSNADLGVFAIARSGAIVGARPFLTAKALKRNSKLEVIAPRPHLGITLWKVARPHQWSKNLLLFVPLIASHQIGDLGKIGQLLGAFSIFCLMASGVYILNDLMDVGDDRRHPQKRKRAIASGELTFGEAMGAGLGLPLLALGLSANLGQTFFLACTLYLVCAQGYNFCKKVPGLDVLGLAGLYTIRIIAGAEAVDIQCSNWLLAFAIFIFFSLACVKRVTELIRLKTEKKRNAGGRGYSTTDQEALTGLGICNGVVSVLVAALYVNSPEVLRLYAHASYLLALCPLILFWVSRVWIKTLRGEVNEDPVLFAIKDRPSWAVLAGCLAIVFLSIK